MKIDVLVAEIGSTTTVVNAFDLAQGGTHFLGQGLSATMMDPTDITVALHAAIDDLSSNLGIDSIKWGSMMATSSAAGGLSMTVHGLVYDMTVKAAKEAALGAGAVLKMVTAGEMTPDDIEELKQIRPKIIMLAGGVDYGEKQTAIRNAQMIAESGLKTPVIYAGNIAARREVEKTLTKAGIKTYIVDTYTRESMSCQ